MRKLKIIKFRFQPQNMIGEIARKQNKNSNKLIEIKQNQPCSELSVLGA